MVAVPKGLSVTVLAGYVWSGMLAWLGMLWRTGVAAPCALVAAAIVAADPVAAPLAPVDAATGLVAAPLALVVAAADAVAAPLALVAVLGLAGAEVCDPSEE